MQKKPRPTLHPPYAWTSVCPWRSASHGHIWYLLEDILAFDMLTEEWMTIYQNRPPTATYTRITALDQYVNQGSKPESWHHIADMCDTVRNHGYLQFLVGEVSIFTRNNETLACDKNGKWSVLLQSYCYNCIHYKPTLYSWEFGERGQVNSFWH
ncbi:hypothetical protein AMTRI_Chr06g178460 [Amborella trichopoda]